MTSLTIFQPTTLHDAIVDPSCIEQTLRQRKQVLEAGVKAMTIVHHLKMNTVVVGNSALTVGQGDNIILLTVENSRWVRQRWPSQRSGRFNKGPGHRDRFIPARWVKGVFTRVSHRVMASFPRVEATNSG